MASRILSCRWSDADPSCDLIDRAHSQHCDYVAVGRECGAAVLELVERELNASPVDVLVVFDPNRRARRPALRQFLPPNISLIAASPEEDVAVALSVRHALDCIKQDGGAPSLAELVLRMSVTGTGSFVEHAVPRQAASDQFPTLTIPAAGPRASWLSRFVEQAQVPGRRSDSTEVVALKAGLYLLNDFFDESHSCSQSIEGLGRHRAGDYWHAILHRREPDYGNAKYWFRHVERHPLFVELARHVTGQISIARGSDAATLQGWPSRLITERGWDSLAFVDLCEAAETDAALRAWCEAVQYEEMLLLLESTWGDVVA